MGGYNGLIFVICIVTRALLLLGHPQCLDFKAPFRPSGAFEYCTEYQSLSCCSVDDDLDIRATFSLVIENLSREDREQCGSFIRDMLCQKCSPYAAHLYDTENQGPPRMIPGLCGEYCRSVFHCRHLISNFTSDANAELFAVIDDADVFCAAVAASDVDYCYPDLLSNRDLTDDIGTREFYQTNTSCVRMCVKEVANKLNLPVSMKHANDGSHRAFLSELVGKVWIFLPDWSKLDVPFLDIEEKVENSEARYDERGFLDLEFHPKYTVNGLFYIYYNVLIGEKDYIRISEMRILQMNMNRADHDYERILLEIYQPEENHNGGQLLFGDDGYLFIFVGDGGGAGDKFGKYGNGQNTSTLLGKVLRIDVDNRSLYKPYRVPRSNPFVRHRKFLPEIYAYGVRNMWRCSKDRGGRLEKNKGRIFCGEVGQNKFEEIDILKKGANYGWRAFEGFSCYDKKMCKDKRFTRNLVKPIFTYSHRIGKSVTGGYVYRGCENPNWYGYYFLGDFMNGRMIMLNQNTRRWYRRPLCLADPTICKNGGLQSSYSKFINAFGEDESGELYFLSTSLPSAGYNGGSVYKLVDPALRGNPATCRRHVRRRTMISTGTHRKIYTRTQGDIKTRLTDGETEASGTLEVYHNREWGLVCGRGWTKRNAHTICKSLGYESALEFEISLVTNSTIWLDNVRCGKDARSLDDCRKSDWGAVTECKNIVRITCDIQWYNEDYEDE